MENHRILENFYFDSTQLLELLKDSSFDHYDYYFLNPTETKNVSNILNIKNVAHILFFTVFYEIGIVHFDNPNPVTGKHHWALNLPLTDLSSVNMNWFVPTDELDLSSNKNKYPKKFFTQVDSVNCNQPTIVSIDRWHNGENPELVKALILSIRFTNDSSIDDVLDNLK